MFCGTGILFFTFLCTNDVILTGLFHAIKIFSIKDSRRRHGKIGITRLAVLNRDSSCIFITLNDDIADTSILK